MDSSWSPDHITIFDFVQMLGPEGMEKLNSTFLKEAQNLGILDSTSLMSDTTAQEAMIMSGQRACLGFNLCKALRLLNQLEVLPA